MDPPHLRFQQSRGLPSVNTDTPVGVSHGHRRWTGSCQDGRWNPFRVQSCDICGRPRRTQALNELTDEVRYTEAWHDGRGVRPFNRRHTLQSPSLWGPRPPGATHCSKHPWRRRRAAGQGRGRSAQSQPASSRGRAQSGRRRWHRGGGENCGRRCLHNPAAQLRFVACLGGCVCVTGRTAVWRRAEFELLRRTRAVRQVAVTSRHCLPWVAARGEADGCGARHFCRPGGLRSPQSRHPPSVWPSGRGSRRAIRCGAVGGRGRGRGSHSGTWHVRRRAEAQSEAWRCQRCAGRRVRCSISLLPIGNWPQVASFTGQSPCIVGIVLWHALWGVTSALFIFYCLFASLSYLSAGTHYDRLWSDGRSTSALVILNHHGSGVAVVGTTRLPIGCPSTKGLSS